MAFYLSSSRRDRVSAEAAFNLEIGVVSRANAGGFILRSAVRELSRPLAQLRWVPVPERDFTSAKSVALITPLEGSEGSELIIGTDSPQQQRWSMRRHERSVLRKTFRTVDSKLWDCPDCTDSLLR